MTEKIYNKITNNKKNTIIFILVLTLLSSIPVFIFPGIKKGHDLYFHLSRICALKDNIKNLNIFNGIYPGYFNGYGYANGLFYPDIFLYIPALLTLTGINVIISYKIFLILINFFSILSIYITIKGISKNKYASILGSIIYAFAPYRLVDIYQRAALGETLAFIFIPLIIYGIYEIIFGEKKKYYLLVLGMTGLLLSHIVSTYIILLIITILCLMNIKKLINEKRILYILLAALITLLLTSFFWIPMLEQMMSQKFYYNNTSDLNEFVLSNRTVPLYFLFLGLPIKSNLLKGYWLPSGIGILFIYMIYKKIKHKEIKEKFINQTFIISVISLLLTTLTPFWKINIIKKIFYPIQFPWRLYMIPTILLTITGSILLSKTNKIKTIRNSFIISMASLIGIFIICIIPPKVKEVIEYDASYSEYLPAEVDRDYIKNRGNIITSNNKVEHTFKQTGTKIEITFKQKEKNTELELPLIYYKGYQAILDNKQLETFKTENGLLGIKINDIEEGTIKVAYKGTQISKITKLISLTTLITLIIVKEVKHEK